MTAEYFASATAACGTVGDSSARSQPDRAQPDCPANRSQISSSSIAELALDTQGRIDLFSAFSVADSTLSR